jgi:hypothetical protein
MNLTRYRWVYLLLGISSALGQQAELPKRGQAYVNDVLGFQYLIPRGMIDKTNRFREQIHEGEVLSGNPRSLRALFAASSGSNSAAANWGSVAIETYPRSWVSEPDVKKAEAQVNAWVAQSSGRSTYGHSAVISGQTFMVSVFGRREGGGTKGAVVWTTVRKGQFLSFAFVSNSPEVLKDLTESMRSVQFH